MQQFHFISRMRSLGKRGKSLGAAAAFAALLGTSAGRTCNASMISLADRNSSLTVNSTATTGPTTPAGVTNWKVDGTNQLNQQWFYYGVGTSGGQTSIDALGLTSSSTFDTNGDHINDTTKLTYGTSHGLQIILTLSLTGGSNGSDASDLTETIKITNNGWSQMDYHFFEYTNFNLGDLTTGQTATITGGNTATVVGNGMQAQTVVSPKPSEFDASLSPTLLNNIASNKSYTLPDVAKSGTGDSEWAFEWDLTLCTGSCAVISIDKDIKGTGTLVVPEPGGVSMLAGIGALYCLATRPRRRGNVA